MKLLIINNDLMVQHDDGLYIEKITGYFLKDLIRLNIKVEFFQFRDRLIDNDCRGTFNIIDSGIRIVTVSLSRYKIISYIKAYCIGVSLVIKNDYLYLFYPNTFSFLALVAIILRKKYGLYIRGEQNINTTISKYLISHSSDIFTVSPIFTQMVNDISGNARTIKPMIEIGFEDIVQNRRYVNKDFYNLLYLGRIEEEKGVFELIKAINILVKSNFLHFQLNIVGDGPDINKLKNLGNKYNLKNYVKFHGTVLNKRILKDMYLEADLFILPSYHEGFPRVLYEAMILGTPILTTFVGTIPYLFKDHHNCYKLEIKDVMSISSIIREVITNYSEKAKIAINATETVREYLSKYSESHSELLVKALIKNS